MPTYEIIEHTTDMGWSSRYAVERDGSGRIVRAYGPVYARHSPVGIKTLLDSSPKQEIKDTADFLNANRGPGTLSEAPMARASQLASAMNAARARTGDRTLAQEVNAGQFRVVRVTYDTRGKSTVVPLTSWSDAETHVQHLNALGLGERGSGHIERRHLIERRRKVRLD